jgi:hypothetical protein
MHSSEQDLTLQGRATAVFSFANAVARDEEFVRAPRPQHFHPQQEGGDHHGMNSIHPDGINGMKVSQRLAIFAGESHVVAHLADSTARFHSPDYVSPCQMLVLQAHFWPSKNSDLP